MLTSLILAMALPASADRLRCEVRHDQIDVTAPAAMDPRLTSMAVVRGKTWLTLVDETHRLVRFMPGTRRIMLPIARQIGIRHGPDGREAHVRAFAARGTYRIVFTYNLETEPENMTMLDCRIRIP